MDEEKHEEVRDGKRIEVCYRTARELGTNFGNPRKITKKKREDLERSLDKSGDWGVIVIDENDDIISGNQRVKAHLQINPDEPLLCKKLIGYTEAEKRWINIKANTHAGDWDPDMMADWTADLSLDIGIPSKDKDPDERKIKDMELIRYEKYDYVMIVCRNEVDYLNLTRILGLDNAKVTIAKRRKIKARAVWYDKIADQIIPKKGEEK